MARAELLAAYERAGTGEAALDAIVADDADRPAEAADLLGRSMHLMLSGSIDAVALTEAVAERAKALERLPGFREDWGERPWEDYSRELDARLRDVSGVHGHRPEPVPVRVDELAWPPGRNDPCWCGSGAKYKRHCGA